MFAEVVRVTDEATRYRVDGVCVIAIGLARCVLYTSQRVRIARFILQHSNRSNKPISVRRRRRETRLPRIGTRFLLVKSQALPYCRGVMYYRYWGFDYDEMKVMLGAQASLWGKRASLLT